MSDTYRRFLYDGTYEGFLCLAVKCLNLRVFPEVTYIDDGSFEDMDFDICRIRTDADIAFRMHRLLGERACVQTQQIVMDGFLTATPDREKALINLIGKSLKYGAIVADDYEDQAMRRIHTAILDLYREEQSYFVTLETTRYKETDLAIISPRNMVLPVMKKDIVRKTRYENLLIYDRRHNMVLYKNDETDDIVDIRRLGKTLPADVRDLYESLWQYLTSGRHLTGAAGRSRRRSDGPDRMWYIAV